MRFNDNMYINRNHDNFVKFIKNYWRYYRELENEFLNTLTYVDLDIDNFNTYSIEYLKLFQAVCNEIDVIGKAMAGEVSKDFKLEITKNNIVKWWHVIQDEFQLTESDIDFDGDRIAICDFENIMLDEFKINAWENFGIDIKKDRTNRDQYVLKSGASTPKWWNDYNRVRDSRALAVSSSDIKSAYSKANLGNVCNAFAALYTLEKAYMQAIGTEEDLKEFTECSRLFKQPRKDVVVVEEKTVDDTDKILNELFSNGLL